MASEMGMRLKQGNLSPSLEFSDTEAERQLFPAPANFKYKHVLSLPVVMVSLFMSHRKTFQWQDSLRLTLKEKQR